MKRLNHDKARIDEIDAKILTTLAADARTSTSDLARTIGLSPPSTAERVKRLEEAGVIRGYHADINPANIGLPLAVHIRVRPVSGQVQKLATLLSKLGSIVECHRVTGDDCFIATAHVASVAEMEALIDRIIPLGTTNTSIIQSSPVAKRIPEIPSSEKK